MGLAQRPISPKANIHGWPYNRGLRLACSRTPIRTNVSKWRRRALKDYVANGRNATLIGNDVRTGLRRIIFSFGIFRLSGLRHQTLLLRCRKVHHLHLLLPTCRILTSIQIPPFAYHFNMADLLCFVAYATMDLVGSNCRGLAEIMA